MPTPIYVTQPFLPPLQELLPSLEAIWDKRILTNAGDFHQSLEEKLAEFLRVEHLSLVTNGTVALSIALEALEVTGEVITTPYSFVATSHALKLRGAEPVFVDIEPDGFNIDPARIESAITERTTAIMPVHCYGPPCDVIEIERIAAKHGLHIVYDAAHSFGVEDPTGFLARGNLSTLSFHATKVFNTFEGGAIISDSADRKRAVDRLRNFGFRDEVTVDALGTNGKMNEFSAALGLVQLDHFEDVRAQRRGIDERYRDALSGVRGVTCPPIPDGVRANHSYFPILIERRNGFSRDEVYHHLRKAGVFARRYFYPLISQFPMYADAQSARPDNLRNATRMADEVLCLPIYPGLAAEDQDRIVKLIRTA